MKVSMLKLVTLASFVCAAQAALQCRTDAFCKTVDIAKPNCIYTSATVSACDAASSLIATGQNCFAISTADAIQCATTDYCPAADGTCTAKIAKDTAFAGSTDAEKKHSCKSGAIDGTNCIVDSDASCTAENGAAKHFVKTSATASACVDASSLIATGQNCFAISTADAIQCATTDYCPAADGACTAKIAKDTAFAGSTDAERKHSCKSGAINGTDCAVVSDASCTAENGATKYFVKFSEFIPTNCYDASFLKAAGQACFVISTADAIQCAATDLCKATTSGFKCATKPTDDATCNTFDSTKPFFTKATASGASACHSGLAKDAACFIKSSAAANQCAAGHYCPETSDNPTNTCTAHKAYDVACTDATECAGACTSGKCALASDADCLTASTTQSGNAANTHFVTASAGAAPACAAPIEKDANCFGVSTATVNQCAAGSYCAAASGTACIDLIATGSDCTGDFHCASGDCDSATNKCAASSPSSHSDARAITASAFVVASTVIASSVFA